MRGKGGVNPNLIPLGPRRFRVATYCLVTLVMTSGIVRKQGVLADAAVAILPDDAMSQARQAH